MSSKVPLTTTIDFRLKQLFDQTSSIHGKNISTLLNESMSEFLKEYCPLEVFDIEIEQKEQELHELRKTKDIAVYTFESIQKETEKKTTTKRDTDPFIEDLRNKKYQEIKEGAIGQLKLGRSPNWERMAPLFQFSNTRDLKEWFFAKMNAEGITV